MSIHNDFIVQIASMDGSSTREVEQGLKPAQLTLSDAQRYGFDSIEDYADAIREMVYG